MIFNFTKNNLTRKIISNSKHAYCLRGYVDVSIHRTSFYEPKFSTRKDAENEMFKMIRKYDLQVKRNEFVDDNVNEVVCNNGRFTIFKIR